MTTADSTSRRSRNITNMRALGIDARPSTNGDLISMPARQVVALLRKAVAAGKTLPPGMQSMLDQHAANFAL